VLPDQRGQEAGQRGNYGAVGPVRLRPGALPAQDGDLVPENQDLRVLAVSLRASRASHPKSRINEQADETDDHEDRA